MSRTILFLNSGLSRPNVSAALASVGTVGCFVRLNTAALKDAGINPASVGAKLRLNVWDVSTATPALLKSVTGAASIVGDGTNTEWGTSVDLTTVITAAGTKILKFTWDLSGNVLNDAGTAVALLADTPAPCSTLFHAVAT